MSVNVLTSALVERGPGGRGLDLVAEEIRVALPQTAADVVVGDEGRARLRQLLVAARVVTVPVGVQHEPHGPVGEAAYGGLDFRGERRELIVDHHDPVFADRDPDVAPVLSWRISSHWASQPEVRGIAKGAGNRSTAKPRDWWMSPE